MVPVLCPRCVPTPRSGLSHFLQASVPSEVFPGCTMELAQLSGARTPLSVLGVSAEALSHLSAAYPVPSLCFLSAPPWGEILQGERRVLCPLPHPGLDTGQAGTRGRADEWKGALVSVGKEIARQFSKK